MPRRALPPPKSSSVEIIIAHRPSHALLKRVAGAGRPVVVVDDGSGPEYFSLFQDISNLPGVTLLRHALPLGRGAALRTAINYLLCGHPEVRRVIVGKDAIPVALLPAILRFSPVLPLYLLGRGFLGIAPWVILAIVLAIVGIESHGFATGNLFAQPIWTPQGQTKLIEFAGLYAAISAAILILVPWMFSRLAAGLLILITLLLLPKAALAVAFVLFSAWCLGSLFGDLPAALSLTLGIALYVAVMPLVARLPVHYPMVYAAVLAVPIAIRRPRLRVPHFSGLSTWGERAAFALMAFVFTLHWFAMLKPEAGADGLAVHLAIPMNIAQHHMLTFEPSRFVWAVMPMGADLAYAIAYMLGGEHAARLLNLALLALLLALLHTAVRRWVSPSAAWLLVALFATTPLVNLVTGGLMSENLLAALLLASLLAIWRRRFLPAALLAGAALSTKLGALPVVILLAGCAAFERPRKRALPALALLIAAAAPPYAIAWAKTHNPLFPFLNERFHSPLLPRNADLYDGRFRKPLNWRTPYDLTFRTNAYYEGQNGSFGFQYLLFAPLAVAAAFVMRRRAAAGAALVALGGCLLVLRSDPNARYLYPELPLLTIPFAGLLGWSAMRSRPLHRVLLVAAAAAALLNIWFLPASSYYHKDFYGPFTDSERQAYLSQASSLRVAIQWFEHAHPGAPVLLTHDTGIAGLTGEVYENQWHQYVTFDRLRQADGVAGVRQLLDQWGVRFFIALRPEAGNVLRPPALRELIARCTIPEYASGDYFIARLEAGCTGPSAPDSPAEPELVAGAGTYDDFDPHLLYRGEWVSSSDFEGPFAHTVSYTDALGAQVAFTFEGDEIAWTFTRASNRGIAAVTIDGVLKGEIDQYGAETKWQDRAIFSGLGPGKHRLVIRATGKQQRASSGAFIDVDALQVR